MYAMAILRKGEKVNGLGHCQDDKQENSKGKQAKRAVVLGVYGLVSVRLSV